MKHFFNIDIPKRDGLCAHAKEKLLPGSEVYSALFEEEETLFRRDYCSHCWCALRKEAELKSAITQWKAVVPEKERESEIFLDRDDKALAFLRKFALSEKAEELHQAMILGLYLSRRRKLYQRKVVKAESGEEIILYETAKTSELLRIKKIDLNRIDIPKVQKMIASNLKN